MVASEQWLAKHRQLLELTLKVRDCARAEQWEEMLVWQNQQQTLSDDLAQSGSQIDLLSQVQSKEMRSLLSQADVAMQEAVARAHAWQGELLQIVQDLESSQSNSVKLARTYSR